jgi:hypothetical protein
MSTHSYLGGQWLALAVVGLLVTGCTAGSHHRAVKVTPYPINADPGSKEFCAARAANAAADKKVDGIRYYRRSPYLLVYSDGKGSVVWNILFLPDPTKKMAVDLEVLTSAYNTTLNFEDGTLKEITEDADATTVPKAVGAAVAQVLPALVKALFDEIDQPGGQPAKAFPAPYLYKIVVAGNTVSFRGGKGDIDVTLQGEQVQ